MNESGELSKMLGSAGADEGSVISLTIGDKEYEGVLMSHRDDIIVIKMKSGYNAGFRVKKGDSVKVIGKPATKVHKTQEHKMKNGLPNIVLIGTGGTIGSKADGGSMRPGLSAEHFLDIVPEVLDVANVKVRNIISVFSENMNVDHWKEIAKATEEELNNGAAGVVISHGTDTMGYTAAALSFMLKEISGPVVLTGSQRPTDRPSSDAPGNIMASVRFCASSKAAGVYVVMHDTMNDDSYAVHRGTRVRKMHTSRRDAFRSVNTVPVAHIDASGKITFKDDITAASKRTAAYTDMEKRVTLLQFYPGMDPALFKDVIMDSKGIVVAGTGLGHVSNEMASLFGKAIGKGAVVVMTSQCMNGPLGMDVYDTGRELRKIGIIPVSDMLPETAYVKLMWALANSKDTDEAKRIMNTRLSYETSDRRTVDVIW
ncbi:MAG: Glu-tRNA(Gln) amidotransferase subunit GatD [Methanomassiliicoccaceae archaeon]|nr:Glu-tRNA(Gln) amidotransferase subunit GatD [Methanomassiliicoccaceae archaeon]